MSSHRSTVSDRLVRCFLVALVTLAIYGAGTMLFADATAVAAGGPYLPRLLVLCVFFAWAAGSIGVLLHWAFVEDRSSNGYESYYEADMRRRLE